MIGVLCIGGGIECNGIVVGIFIVEVDVYVGD